MNVLLSALALATGALLAALLFHELVREGKMGPAAMLTAAVLAAAVVSLVAMVRLRRTRHRELVGNLCLAGFSMMATYLILDLIAGWFLIRPLSPPLVADSIRHHRLVPSSFAEFQQRDFSYIQRVNAHGLRGEDIATAKAPGTYRILMLGDSFTMGKGVEDDQTFSVLLAAQLAADPSTCRKPIDVLNAGVDSYAPILGLLYLKHDLLPLAPDLVIYNLDVSDLIQESVYRKQAERAPDGEIIAVPQEAEPESFVEMVRIWSERHLFLTRVVMLYANQMLGYHELTVRDVVNRADHETVAHTLKGDVDRHAEWAAIFDSVDRMKRLCEEHHIGFVLSIYPWAHQISETEWIPGRYAFMARDAKPSETSRLTIHQMASDMGITLLDATPAFQAYHGNERLYFQYDMHWTPAGHQVMAGALREFLVHDKAAEWCGDEGR